jgi:hypothetical protein
MQNTKLLEYIKQLESEVIRLKNQCKDYTVQEQQKIIADLKNQQDILKKYLSINTKVVNEQKKIIKNLKEEQNAIKAQLQFLKSISPNVIEDIVVTAYLAGKETEGLATTIDTIIENIKSTILEC